MKRFTDTDKWSDKFFRTLTPSGKIFWIWLCDNCDNAGIWERDDDLFKFFSGILVEVDAHIEELGERIEILDDGKILLPKFVLFQQGGMLNEDKPPHRQILKILEKNGLEQRECGEIRKANERQSKGKAKVKQTLSKGKAKAISISKGKGKGKGKEEESEEEIRPEGWTDRDMEDFRPAWNAYLQHRKENKWKSPTPTMKEKLFKKFAKAGKPQSILAIERSISSGWQGVFPENDSHNKITQFIDDDRDYDNATSLN